jgi:hypothetical protein
MYELEKLNPSVSEAAVYKHVQNLIEYENAPWPNDVYLNFSLSWQAPTILRV